MKISQQNYGQNLLNASQMNKPEFRANPQRQYQTSQLHQQFQQPSMQNPNAFNYKGSYPPQQPAQSAPARVSKFSTDYQHPLQFRSGAAEDSNSFGGAKPPLKSASANKPTYSQPFSHGVKRNRSPSPGDRERERERDREREREKDRREREKEKDTERMKERDRGERERERSRSNSRNRKGRLGHSSSPVSSSNKDRGRERERERGSAGRFKSFESMSDICASVPISDMIEEYCLPSLSKYGIFLSAPELYTRFPNIYIPDDFIHLEVDNRSISEALNDDILPRMVLNAPIIFESAPGTLSAEVCGALSDVQPKPTNLVVNTVNNKIAEDGYRGNQFVNNEKPVKFNAKVIVCCGFRDPEKDRVDNNLTRNLRFERIHSFICKRGDIELHFFFVS